VALIVRVNTVTDSKADGPCDARRTVGTMVSRFVKFYWAATACW